MERPAVRSASGSYAPPYPESDAVRQARHIVKAIGEGGLASPAVAHRLASTPRRSTGGAAASVARDGRGSGGGAPASPPSPAVSKGDMRRMAERLEGVLKEAAFLRQENAELKRQLGAAEGALLRLRDAVVRDVDAVVAARGATVARTQSAAQLPPPPQPQPPVPPVAVAGEEEARAELLVQRSPSIHSPVSSRQEGSPQRQAAEAAAAHTPPPPQPPQPRTPEEATEAGHPRVPGTPVDAVQVPPAVAGGGGGIVTVNDSPYFDGFSPDAVTDEGCEDHADGNYDGAANARADTLPTQPPPSRSASSQARPPPPPPPPFLPQAPIPLPRAAPSVVANGPFIKPSLLPSVHTSSASSLQLSLPPCHPATFVPAALAGGSAGRFPVRLMRVPAGLTPPAAAGAWEPMMAEGKLFKLLLGGSEEEGGGAGSSNNRTLLFYNGTADVHFTLTYTFGPQSVLEAGPTTVVEGRDYSVEVPAGGTVRFVCGAINGYRMTVKYGPPSQQFVDGLTARCDARVADDVAALRRAAERSSGAEAAAGGGGGGCDDASLLAMCRQQGVLYVDERFPPCAASLCPPGAEDWVSWPWMRPQECLTADAAQKVRLWDEKVGVVPTDVVHGRMGVSWLTCALAVLAERPWVVRGLFDVPAVGAAASDGRSGGFALRVNQDGWWHTVVVDSYLPVVGKTCAFGSNSGGVRSVWVPVLEKAVAKLHGSYYAVAAGDPLDVLRAATGLPAEPFDWGATGAGEGLFARMLALAQAGAGVLMMVEARCPDDPGVGAKRRADTEAFFEASGIVPGYSYALLDAKRDASGQRLCLIRNPWDGGSDGGGAEAVSEADGASADGFDDGQQQQQPGGGGGDHAASFSFWISFEHLAAYFKGGGACLVPPSPAASAAAASPGFDVRVASELQQGAPLHMLAVHAAEEAEVFLGLHQADAARSGGGGGGGGPAPVVLMVLEPVAEAVGGGVRLVAQTNGGAFARAKDLHLHHRFLRSDRPYYVVWQGAEEGGALAAAGAEPRQLVASLVASRSFGAIHVLQPSASVVQALRTGDLASLNPDTCLASFSRVQVNKGEHTLRRIEMGLS